MEEKIINKLEGIKGDISFYYNELNYRGNY